MTNLKTAMAFNITQLRQQFPLIDSQPLIYFDNAATTQKPQAVLQALQHYYQHTNANVHRGAHRLSDAATAHYENARKTLQEHINAQHWQEIIWTKGTTESINLVASTWGEKTIQQGDTVVISAAEHHANIVPWQQLCLRKNAHLAVINLTETGHLDLDHYQKLLERKPKLVAVPHISNVLGLLNPIDQIIDLAHQVGAKVLIDGAQSMGHEVIDVQWLDCDFFAASAHKAYGPTGLGFLYAKKALLEDMPPWQMGGEMIQRVSFHETVFNDPPFKFEAGTPPIAEAIAFAAALTFLQQQPLNDIRAYKQLCVDTLFKGLNEMANVTTLGSGENRRGLVAFTIDDHHPYDVGQLLNQAGIATRAGHHCAMPLMDVLGLKEGCCRASLGIYNTVEEVETFLNQVHSISKRSVTSGPTLINEDHIQNKGLIEKVSTLKGWQQKLNLLTQHAQSDQSYWLNANGKSEHNRLHGCTSNVWLDHQFDDNNGLFVFRIDADSKIIKGLAAIIVEAVNGKTAEEINTINIEQLLKTLGLKQHLSPSRSNGLHTITSAIKAIAAKEL